MYHGIVAGTNPPARTGRERDCEGQKEKERRVPCYERVADAMQASDSHLASRGNAWKKKVAPARSSTCIQ